MFGGSSLVFWPDKSHGSSLLLIEVWQPGDDGKEDDGEKEEDEARIFLPWRVKDLWSGMEGVGALPHHKTVVLLLSLY